MGLAAALVTQSGAAEQKMNTILRLLWVFLGTTHQLPSDKKSDSWGGSFLGNVRPD
jgi:hypothetical protein